MDACNRCHAQQAQQQAWGVLVLLCIRTTAAAAVLTVHSSSKAVTVQLEALGLLAVTPLGTTARHEQIIF